MSSLESRAFREHRDIDMQAIHENETKEFNLRYSDDLVAEADELNALLDSLEKDDATVIDENIKETREKIEAKEKETGIDFSEAKKLVDRFETRIKKAISARKNKAMLSTKTSAFKKLMEDQIESYIKFVESSKKYNENANSMLPDIIEEIKEMALEKGEELEKALTDSVNALNEIDLNKYSVEIMQETMEKQKQHSSLVDNFMTLDETVETLNKAGLDDTEAKDKMTEELLNNETIDADTYTSEIEDEIVEEPTIEEKEEAINETPLEFTKYVRSLTEKYRANDYHRMMSDEETKKFLDLYTEAFEMDREEVKDALESTIEKQLNPEKTEQQIKKQGLAQEKLNVITQDYRSKYGQNFPAYLDEESLENYTIAYLHAYDARRSDVEKMYDDALNNEYADKIEPSEMEPSSKTMGYAKAWLLTIIMLVTSIIVFIFCIMISK